MEDKAMSHPTKYAQVGYTYQRLKVSGWYSTKEHINVTCGDQVKINTK